MLGTNAVLPFSVAPCVSWTVAGCSTHTSWFCMLHSLHGIPIGDLTDTVAPSSPWGSPTHPSPRGPHNPPFCPCLMQKYWGHWWCLLVFFDVLPVRPSCSDFPPIFWKYSVPPVMCGLCSCSRSFRSGAVSGHLNLPATPDRLLKRCLFRCIGRRCPNPTPLQCFVSPFFVPCPAPRPLPRLILFTVAQKFNTTAILTTKKKEKSPARQDC